MSSDTALSVLRVTDIVASEQDVRHAITDLYAERLPLEQRYGNAEFIDLIRRHLSGDYGPRRPAVYWKTYFLVAKQKAKVIGMLLGYNYNDTQNNFLYVPYLVVQKPQPNTDNAIDISRTLINEFTRIQRSENAGREPVSIAELDDPAETDNPNDRAKRRARVRRLSTIASFANVKLRCLDLRFIQPRLDVRTDTAERQLLILYGKAAPPHVLSKAEVVQIITFLYKQLYAANMFDDPDEDRDYQRYLDRLLESAIESLPDCVRLLRLQQVYG